MEMRDRLIDGKEYARQMRENAVKDENGIVRVSIELWEKIADIIERSIIPPCKVGDIIWVYDFMWGLIPCTVDKPYHCVCGEKGGCTFEMCFADDDIGKTVFLTEEEAEKTLKEREGNG